MQLYLQGHPNPLLVEMSPQLRLFPCLLAVAVVVALPTVTTPKPADPFADPAHDPYNPLKYIPNDVLSGVSTGARAFHWLTTQTEFRQAS